ncbi:hypothetical protein [Brevundimonas variabilis]|nr:hypothetical protein [Brevundimonas variabilis]
MDRSEQGVARYLEGLSLGSVCFEPDGNVPPDFLVGGRIAVEARRLNQNFESDGGYQGLEHVEAPVAKFVDRLLPTFGEAPAGKGWWVFFYFWRPFDWKVVKREMKAALEAFRTNPAPAGLQVHLDPNFELEIRPATIVVEHHFMLGGYADWDAGGFVASEIIRNLNLCVAEKTRKIAPYRDRYAEWWLVLPDRIGPDLNMDERRSIGDHVDLLGFDRVVLIHPNDPAKALVLAPSGPT